MWMATCIPVLIDVDGNLHPSAYRCGWQPASGGLSMWMATCIPVLIDVDVNLHPGAYRCGWQPASQCLSSVDGNMLPSAYRCGWQPASQCLSMWMATCIPVLIDVDGNLHPGAYQVWMATCFPVLIDVDGNLHPVCGNLLIIILVPHSKVLHTPMYFFLTQLSIADIVLLIDIIPNLLKMVLNTQVSMSFSSCIVQYYFFSTSEGFECFLLMVMSYDRYLAICSLLHYVSIMGRTLCTIFILSSWLLGGSIALVITLGISQFEFCGSNIIDHIFCDIIPLEKLSCSDLSILQIEIIVFSIPMLILPFLLIVVSYMYIVSAILKISTVSGKLKSFSTCSSHLTVVFIFYGTLFVMYILPSQGQSQMSRKILGVVYTLFVPFINPLIYSLRNKDIKEALKNAVYVKRSSK
ncbi:olfactory receptor 1468-like [Gastrophryne carolinensis]